MTVYIIASAKCEELYIKKWVEHHLNLGFDKIIINDNNSKDYKYQLKDILKKYIDAGQVVIERYFDTHEQTYDTQLPDLWKILSFLYDKYKSEFDWAAKLDIDEYLEIPETNNDIKKFLEQDKFNNAQCIHIPWLNYKVKEEYKYKFVNIDYDKKFIVNDSSASYKKYKDNYKYIVRSNTDIKKIGTHAIDYSFIHQNTDSIFDSCGNNAMYLFDEDNKNITIANEEYKKYLFNLYSACYIKHYRHKSEEEMLFQYEKMEIYKDIKSTKQQKYKQYYDELIKKYPNFKENMEIAYKQMEAM